MYYQPEDKSYRVVYKRQVDFIHPRDRHYPMAEAYTEGGAVIGKTDDELQGYVWKAYIKGDKVLLHREDSPTDTLLTLVTQKGVTQIDITFDQTMRPFLTYVAGGKAYYLHFNANSSKYEKVALPNDVTSPRCEIDYRDKEDISKSDIILGYTNQGKLCYRIQRERFSKEHVIMTDPKKTLLWRVGRLKDGSFGYQWR